MQYIQEAYLIQLNKLGDLLRLHNTDPVSGTHGHFVAAVIIGFHGLAFALSATGNLYNDLIFRGQDNASLVQAVGQIGVRVISFALGSTSGPPADRLYPVDPVGVVTIIPSAL